MHRIEGTYNQAGSFSDGPPGTEISAGWLNAVQEELALLIESQGLSLAESGVNDNRSQLLVAINRHLSPDYWDVVVYNQRSFNRIIERVVDNHYRIRPEYRTVFIRNIPGGYKMSGPDSFLSAGDSWGKLDTGACLHIKADWGTVFYCLDSPFYISISATSAASGIKFENIWVKGNSELTSIPTGLAIAPGFYLPSQYNNATFINCRVSHRKGVVVGFLGNSTYGYDYTSTFSGCSVHDCDVSSGYGFAYCCNLTACMVHDFYSYDASTISGFYYCYNISGSSTSNIGVLAGHIPSTSSGFYHCEAISSCLVYTLKGDDVGNGFDSCSMVSGCYVNGVTSVNAASNANGFLSCSLVSACYVTTVNCGAGVGSVAAAYRSCTSLTGCYAISIDGTTNNAFKSCSYISAVYSGEAANPGNDWVNTNDAQIVNQYSCPAIWT